MLPFKPPLPGPLRTASCEPARVHGRIPWGAAEQEIRKTTVNTAPLTAQKEAIWKQHAVAVPAGGLS
ncbi:MAG: hypothetical protein ACOX08_00285 [Methanobacterium sp.]